MGCGYPFPFVGREASFTIAVFKILNSVINRVENLRFAANLHMMRSGNF